MTTRGDREPSATDAASALRALERGESVAYVASGGVWVMALFATPTTADMLLARSALQKMTDTQPSGFATLTWILPEAGYRMESEARQAAAEVTKRFDKAIRAQATLIEGSGFQAAAVRGIVAGLDVMSRTSSSKRTFSELAPAIAWCLTEVPQRPAPSPHDVVRQLEGLRESLRTGR